ncbi:MAG: septum formation protein [Sulfitobacter sp.]
MVQLILGSTSPRRASLLSQLGVPFTVLAPEVDESHFAGEAPFIYVARMSNEKHAAVSRSIDSGPVIIAADTVVLHDDDILGKPENEDEGFSMLRRLSGSQHRVLTSVTIGSNGINNQQFVVETIVRFRTLTTTECRAYWHTGEPQDKAGGYGIQGVGAIFIESIQGSYTNVVGLPLTETAQLLRGFRISILD